MLILSLARRARGDTTAARRPGTPHQQAPGRASIPALTPMPAVPEDEYDTAETLQAIRRERSERRARYRGRWWFPFLIVGVVVTGFWGALKVDQRVAEELVWPTHGARFVEVSSSLEGPPRPGGRLTIVVGGLNGTSGTGVALALLPTLEADSARVFSLVYGSGINDQDIRDKFDALVAEVKPRDVSFFGSSMGGDVVLNMAAHAQQSRDQYAQEELVGTVGGGDAGRLASAGSTELTDPAEIRPLGAETGSLTDFLVPAALTDTLTGLMGGIPTDAIDGSTTGSGSTAAGASSNGSVSDGRNAGTDTRTGAATGTGGRAGGRAAQPTVTLPPPRIGTIFLDCTPLGTDDVRDASRTQADALTGLTEAIGTDGGAVTRLSAEMLGQRNQWASGRFPFLQIRYDDFAFKFDQVMREKIGGPGVSTQLLKDQYGVIRRIDIDDVVGALAPGTRIVYFLPQTRTDDHTVRVEQVETELRALQTDAGLDVRFVEIPGGHHASAESDAESYRLGIASAEQTGP